MNYLVLSKIYKLVNDDSECECSKTHYFTLNNYDELIDKLNNFNYDYTPDKILIDVKYHNNIEEALVSTESLILTSDNKEVKYNEIQFILKWYCPNTSVIEIKDDKKYCKTCFENISRQLTFRAIKSILESEDEMNGLSTSEKITYILIKNKGTKLSAAQIYELGDPWNLKTMTPKESVYARTSTLYKDGKIKKMGIMYYI